VKYWIEIDCSIITSKQIDLADLKFTHEYLIQI